jgi:hypothetical protein
MITTGWKFERSDAGWSQETYSYEGALLRAAFHFMATGQIQKVVTTVEAFEPQMVPRHPDADSDRSLLHRVLYPTLDEC